MNHFREPSAVESGFIISGIPLMSTGLIRRYDAQGFTRRTRAPLPRRLCDCPLWVGENWNRRPLTHSLKDNLREAAPVFKRIVLDHQVRRLFSVGCGDRQALRCAKEPHISSNRSDRPFAGARGRDHRFGCHGNGAWYRRSHDP